MHGRSTHLMNGRSTPLLMNGRSTPLSLKERREMYMLEQQGGETVGARAMEEVEVEEGEEEMVAGERIQGERRQKQGRERGRVLDRLKESSCLMTEQRLNSKLERAPGRRRLHRTTTVASSAGALHKCVCTWIHIFMYICMFTCVCVCVCMHSKRLKRLPRLCEDGGPVEEQEDTHTQTMNRRRTHTHTKGRRRTHTHKRHRCPPRSIKSLV